MSDLIHVKGVILSYLDATVEVKQAILDMINVIDSAIDEAGGFENDDEIQLAIVALDAALIGQANAEDIDIVDISTDDDDDLDPLEGLNEDGEEKSD